MNTMKAFEVPVDMRKFAEQSMDQARKAFGTFVGAAQEAMSDLEGRASAARAGALDVGGRAMVFAERNMAASFEFAQKLVHAKDVEEVLKIQTDYVQGQIETLNQQVKELADLAARAASDAGNPKT